MIKLEGVTRVFSIGLNRIEALKDITLEIGPKEFVAIIGPSGSGKSTLMSIIGCLDRPSYGSYMLEGTDIAHLTDNELAYLRNKKFGFIFQTFNLLPAYNALRNVELPLLYIPNSGVDREGKAREVLKAVGLGDRLDHRPNELSGGEQQRVAIARALVNDPAVILADEPTGNLDSRTGEEILGILKRLNEEGRTVILVTHDQRIAEKADRRVHIIDGRITKDEVVG